MSHMKITRLTQEIMIVEWKVR